MDKINEFKNEIESTFISKIKDVLEGIALEGHLLGSFGRGDFDEFSDLDIWVTFSDEDFSSFKENRFVLFGEIGEVIHVCEPHQNAPINGIFSTVIYKFKTGLFVVDYYFCPKSTAFITDESKSLFGDVILPTGVLSLNPQSVKVVDSYRIDFFICFIFGGIKSIMRKKENPLQSVFREYDNLKKKYNIDISPITTQDHNFSTLFEVIENISKVSNDKQKGALDEINAFIKEVLAKI